MLDEPTAALDQQVLRHTSHSPFRFLLDARAIKYNRMLGAGIAAAWDLSHSKAMIKQINSEFGK